MATIIARLPHSCGTKKGLNVFAEEGEISGYCFACNTYVPHPYGVDVDIKDIPKPKVKTPQEIEAEIVEITAYTTVDVTARKLRQKNLEKFNIKVGLSEEDGHTPKEVYQPYTKNGSLCAYKVKILENGKTFWLGDGKDVDLFNWENAKRSGAYRLIITEGELDSVAVDRIFEMHGKEEYSPAIVSLPYGAGRARQSLQKHAEEIKRTFKEILFCFDNDKPGQDAVSECMLVFPQAKNVILPEKDANDCLIQGKAKAAYNAIAFNAVKPKNTRIIMGMDIHEKAKEPAKYGELTWPWHKMNEDLRGIRLGETIYIGAGTKMGKTTLKNALNAHFISNNNVKVFMACPEEPNEMTYKLMANQLTGKVFHDPKVVFDEEAFEEAGKQLRDKLYMLNLYQHVGWQTLKEDIVAAVSEGCKVVTIDPITNITNGISSGEANTMLQEFAQELSAMALDMNFVAFLFAHLKASEGQIAQDKRQAYYAKHQYLDLGNCSHEMGGSIYSAQFAGSRAMQRSCNLMLGLLGNKDPDLPEEIRNTRQIRTLEDRAWGSSGKYNLYYNKNTGQFVEL
jgi:twinkle protein